MQKLMLTTPKRYATYESFEGGLFLLRLEEEKANTTYGTLKNDPELCMQAIKGIFNYIVASPPRAVQWKPLSP